MMRPGLYRVIASACLIVAAALLGCESRQTGNEGKLVFAYPNDDDVADFNKAVAVGARLELRVSEVGLAGAKVEVVEASSDNAQALAVVAKLGDRFEIEAKAEGNAKISVRARKSDGTEVTDSVNLRALKAEVLSLAHSCAGGDTGTYLTNRMIFLPYDLTRKDGQATIGYGYHPLTISPAAALTFNVNNKAQWAYAYQTAALPGDVSLTSQLDPSKVWNLRLVDEGAIDGAKLEFGGLGSSAKVGQKHYAMARPMVGAAPLCQPETTFTVTSTTPDVCSAIGASQATAATLKLLGTQKGAQAEAWTWIEVLATKTGTCEFTVTWPKAAGGKGYTAALKVEVK